VPESFKEDHSGVKIEDRGKMPSPRGEEIRDNRERRYPMGDKGKKDKDKGQKQKTNKQDQKAKK
jgi:hypothetical protein